MKNPLDSNPVNVRKGYFVNEFRKQDRKRWKGVRMNPKTKLPKFALGMSLVALAVAIYVLVSVIRGQ